MEKQRNLILLTCDWEWHLREILEHFPPVQQDSEELLFSVTLDGVKYTLLARAVRHEPTPSMAALSRRESQVVDRVARGLSNKLIAEELQISPHTVTAYLRRIFVKLSVSSRAAMVAVMVRRGPGTR